MSKLDQLQALRAANVARNESRAKATKGKNSTRPGAIQSSDGIVESRHEAMAANPLVGSAEAKKVDRSISRSGGVTTIPSDANSKRGRGRPKVHGKRPWEVEGMSRRTWYRRQSKLSGEKK